MAWSTSVISPPDGDMRRYMESLELLLDRDDALYWPTHGPAVLQPKPHVEAFIAHRREREAQVLACIDRGLHQIETMVPTMYADLPEFMYAAAARSVFSAIMYMVDRGELRTDGPVSLQAEYFRA
jgi:glyoxylase-like metal-dependent hydrolase (beta-lactamase superfamily II)